MKYIEYTTKQGDRLDIIAFNAYGNALDWSLITDNNPQLPIIDVYEAGIKIIIPVQEVETSQVKETNLLPPWKR